MATKTNAPKKRPARLGRGLSSLMAQPVAVAPLDAAALGDAAVQGHDKQSVANAAEQTAGSVPDPTSAASQEGSDAAGALRYVEVGSIRPNPHQPRQQFDEAALESLAASIKSDGLMQPIVLRPARAPAGSRNGDMAANGATQREGTYELVAGERRWRAAQRAGLARIPAIIRELDDQQLAELALIENLQREDLNPIDRAQAFERLTSQFGMNNDQIASRVGLNRTTISNMLRLLDLSDYVQQLVRDDLLSMGQARAVAGLADPAQQQTLAKLAVREGLSVRDVEQAVRRMVRAGGGGAVNGEAARHDAGAAGANSIQMEDLQKQIGQQLGTRVIIRPGRKKGTGKLTIEFYSLDGFDGLLERLGVTIE